MSSLPARRSGVADHRKMIVWGKAVDVAVEVHRIVALLPAAQRFRLVPQIEGAAISIAANIAEGKGRNHLRDYARFVAIARGSARELDTYFELSRRVGYLSDEQLQPAEDLLDQVQRMLTVLLRRLTPR